jgi:serine phosphatase RsbU (regulator of sigma subunit)
LTLDGAIRQLNAAMAMALGWPVERCLGRRFGDLWPEGQGVLAESLVAHAATTKMVAMRTLEFPGPGGVAVACLIEAQRVKDPAGGELLLWVHALDARNDLASLLIPFRMAANATKLGLWAYAPYEHRLEWVGGAPALAALFPGASVSLSRVVRCVHQDDRGALRGLLRSASTQSPWTRLRFHTEHDGWHHLVCRTRRIQLGYGGPERIFAVVRNDTDRERPRQEMLVALSAERQRADEIVTFASALVTAVTEQQLQQVVLTRLAATFGAAAALIALVDNGGLRFATDAGAPMDQIDALHDALCGLSMDEPRPLPHAIRTGEPQFIRNREDYLRRWPQAAGLPWLGSDVAVLITPLSPVSDRPLGAWVVVYEDKHRPSPNEQAHVGTLADLAGQALRRVRSHQAHVELATALQKSMLPTLPEHLPGLEVAARYRPSRDGLDVGGDWYDAFLMSDGAVALVIGDVQGHDVDAAACMGQVRVSMRAIAAHEPHPGAVLARANDLLVTMDAPRFASCTMLRVDPRDGRVTGSSAGHVPLLSARRDGSHDIRQLPGGPVLGVLPDAEYPEGTFHLDRDSALVMVTDGVVEGPGLTLDAGLEQAGTLAAQALQDGLNAEETADRILDAAATVDHLDDVAILVIRRT